MAAGTRNRELHPTRAGVMRTIGPRQKVYPHNRSNSAGIFETVINKPDGIKAFTKVPETGILFWIRPFPSSRSIRGIPDQEVNRNTNTMIPELSTLPSEDTRSFPGITCPQAFTAGYLP